MKLLSLFTLSLVACALPGRPMTEHEQAVVGCMLDAWPAPVPRLVRSNVLTTDVYEPGEAEFQDLCGACGPSHDWDPSHCQLYAWACFTRGTYVVHPDAHLTPYEYDYSLQHEAAHETSGYMYGDVDSGHRRGVVWDTTLFRAGRECPELRP